MTDGWTPEEIADKMDHEGGMEELLRWGFRAEMVDDNYPELKTDMYALEELFWEYEDLRESINLPDPGLIDY